MNKSCTRPSKIFNISHEYSKNYPISNLDGNMILILDPALTNHISVMPVLDEPPDTILGPPTIPDPGVETNNILTYQN